MVFRMNGKSFLTSLFDTYLTINSKVYKIYFAPEWANKREKSFVNGFEHRAMPFEQTLYGLYLLEQRLQLTPSLASEPFLYKMIKRSLKGSLYLSHYPPLMKANSNKNLPSLSLFVDV